LKSSTKLPNKAQELVDSISSLEITISKLETDLSDLRYQLCHVRTERLLVESNPECLLSTPSTSKCTWDEHTSALRDFKLEEYESVQSMEEYRYPELEERHDVEKESENREKVSTSGQLEEHQDVTLNIFLEEHQDEEVLFHAHLPVVYVLCKIFGVVSEIKFSCSCRCKNQALQRRMAKSILE
uniref:Ternary complex factor MIP1 leucine-zipper domain-containing protein n=1 Tax=Aegilops tauschii subsp. strangulata TaxID=200361 RepID=A0A453SS34_AEGTS